MSWWSDGEPFDEHDPDYCVGCTLDCDHCPLMWDDEPTKSEAIMLDD